MQLNFDPTTLKTPCYVVDEILLRNNLEKLRAVADRSGCKILLAQKAFSMFSVYPLIAGYLDGATASGLFEARLAYEHLGGENHIFSPAYKEKEFAEILAICGHLVFNSFAQWEKFKSRALAAGKNCGLRLNPELSTQDHAIYDPCAPGSRLGVTAGSFRPDLLDGLSGFHFHTLCEQNFDALAATLEAVEQRFGRWLGSVKWLNLGGGHHITRADYDVEGLIKALIRLRDKYGLTVYLEPGEAVALNAGFLVATVLDIVNNGLSIAILDTSAACHMPDVLEMPYRPEIMGAAWPGEKLFNFRLAGPTCLAGDVIGDYSFDRPLVPGDRLVFGDMAHYSMVKNNTFNGVNLPDIVLSTLDGETRLVRSFGYEDFKGRLS